VGDGLGVELEDDGVAHPPGEADGLSALRATSVSTVGMP
jgi:hypothetical protein